MRWQSSNRLLYVTLRSTQPGCTSPTVPAADAAAPTADAAAAVVASAAASADFLTPEATEPVMSPASAPVVEVGERSSICSAWRANDNTHDDDALDVRNT